MSLTPEASPSPTPVSPPNPGRATAPAIAEGAKTGDDKEERGGAEGGRYARQAEVVARVDVVDDSFEPTQLTVTVGTTVIWTHRGRHPHTVTADDRSFDSGTLERGQTFSVAFDRVGRIPYYCQIHGEPGSGMIGLVIVRAAPAQGEDPGSPTPGADALAGTGLDPGPLGVAAIWMAIVGLVALRLGRRPTGEGR